MHLASAMQHLKARRIKRMVVYSWIASAARRGAPVFAILCLAGLFAANPGAALAPEPGLSREAAESTANKLRQIQDASQPGHSFGLVRINEAEANSYLYYDMASSFPPGISKAHLKLEPGRPHGTAEVDFDRLMGSLKTPPNPLVAYLLRGVHTLGVDGTFSGANGMAQFRLETVTLDDVAVPQMVVDYLIDHYLKAHYPDVSVDRPFPLPSSIQRLSVEAGSIVVVGHPMTSGR
jgi:hypothetical protein